MLNKTELQADILALLQDMAGRETDPFGARMHFATELANLIDLYIKSAQVTIPSGAIVTTGTATTQSNAAPVIVNGGLS